MVVSSQNDFLPSNLSRADVKKILTFNKWSDIYETWSDRTIKRIVPSAQWSGVSVLFVKNILQGDLNKLLNASNTKLYDFEEEVIQEALTNPDVIGIIGYDYYKQNKQELKMISIDGIAPNDTKNYPFINPMFIYSDIKLIRERPEVRGFINFYLQNVDEGISNTNSLPVEKTALNQSKIKLKNILKFKKTGNRI